MVSTTLPPGGCSGVCMSVNSSMLAPLLALSAPTGLTLLAVGVSVSGWEKEHLGVRVRIAKGISSMKSFMPRAHRVVAEGPGNFPHSPGLKQEHFLEHGPFPEKSKTW